MAPRPETRSYNKVARARKEEATRKRIAEAAVALHGTLGPARTSIADVAREAGVSRTTVYNHFPTDVELFAACSSHWASRNPFPDPASWREIGDPAERLGSALRELYAWYGGRQDMLGKVFRDLPIVPALAEVMGGFWAAYLEEVIEGLTPGWPRPAAEGPELRALLSIVLDFRTWRALADGLADEGDAAALAARMVAGALPIELPRER